MALWAVPNHPMGSMFPEQRRASKPDAQCLWLPVSLLFLCLLCVSQTKPYIPTMLLATPHLHSILHHAPPMPHGPIHHMKSAMTVYSSAPLSGPIPQSEPVPQTSVASTAATGHRHLSVFLHYISWVGALVGMTMLGSRYLHTKSSVDTWSVATVDIARQGASGRPVEGAEGIDPELTSITIAHVPDGIGWSRLKEHFSYFGDVAFVQVSRSTQRAFVRYHNAADAHHAALEANKYPLIGHTLEVALSPKKWRPEEAEFEGPNYDTEWQRSPHDIAANGSKLDNALAAEVQTLIHSRNQYRAAGEFARADAIRNQLLEKGITLDDKLQCWYVQLDPSLDPSVSTGPSPPEVKWTRRLDDTRSGAKADGRGEEFEKVVEATLMRREELKRQHFYSKAEVIRRALRTKGIIINDATHTWYSLSSSDAIEVRSIIVRNLPLSTSWVTLREHFNSLGEVEFAAVFQDPSTGKATGSGVVRFKSSECAVNALSSIADFPLDGHVLTAQLDLGFPIDMTPKGTKKSKSLWKRRSEDRTADGSEEDTRFQDMVEEALERRQQFRDQGRFAEADAIREELKKQHVLLNDKTQTWFRKNMEFQTPEEYTCVVARNLPPGTSWMQLRQHFAKRFEVRFAGIFYDRNTMEPTGGGVVRFASKEDAQTAIATADEYPMDGVILKLEPDRLIVRNSNPVTPSTFSWKRHPNDLTADNSPQDKDFADHVQKLLHTRQQFRNQEQFSKADEIRHKLEAEGVVLDSVQRTWSLGPIDNFPWVRAENDDAADGTIEDDALVQKIQKLLSRRQAAKYLRHFERADSLELQLRELGVKMDGYKRVWWSGNLQA